MDQDLIEAGKIVATHGIKGEVRIYPWCDSPEFLCGFSTLYIGNKPYKCSVRTQGSMAIAALEGVDDVRSAMALKDLTVYINRRSVELEPGRYFVRDLIGLKALCAQSGEELGTVTDVLKMPAQDVWEITGSKKYLVPAVGAFVAEVNPGEGFVKLRMIEGLEI
ncbi:MAG: 16S rRNA processing protein RimM [Clostridiales bacterium]|nr:16S rRNA processing protein RimM [Clostridiales bacterium]